MEWAISTGRVNMMRKHGKTVLQRLQEDVVALEMETKK